jgi:Ras-related protein Rab-1A
MTHIPDCDHIFKIVLIGDPGVGKTCLLTRFADNTYLDTTLSTLGIDFKSRSTTFQGRVVKLRFWDTAGQDRYRTVTSSFYRGAHGIMLAYDTTNSATFDNLGYWLEQVKRHKLTSCPIVLVGTKADIKDHRAVSEEALRAFAEQHCGEANNVVETSAKTNEGVDHAFQLLTEQIFRRTVTTGHESELPQRILERSSSYCSC